MDPKLLRSLVVTLIPALLVGLLGGYLLDSLFTRKQRRRLPSRSMDEYDDDDGDEFEPDSEYDEPDYWQAPPEDTGRHWVEREQREFQNFYDMKPTTSFVDGQGMKAFAYDDKRRFGSGIGRSARDIASKGYQKAKDLPWDEYADTSKRYGKKAAVAAKKAAVAGYKKAKDLPWDEYADTSKRYGVKAYEGVRDLPWDEYGKRLEKGGSKAYDRAAKAYQDVPWVEYRDAADAMAGKASDAVYGPSKPGIRRSPMATTIIPGRTTIGYPQLPLEAGQTVLMEPLTPTAIDKIPGKMGLKKKPQWKKNFKSKLLIPTRALP